MLLSGTGMRAYPLFHTEKLYKKTEADTKNYTWQAQRWGLREREKHLYRLAPGKPFTFSPSHSLSARINAPKSPKARSSYMLSIIQPASFVQPLLFTRTAWPIVNVCVLAEPPSPPSHTRWLHSDLALFCHPPPLPHHSHRSDRASVRLAQRQPERQKALSYEGEQGRARWETPITACGACHLGWGLAEGTASGCQSQQMRSYAQKTLKIYV